MIRRNFKRGQIVRRRFEATQNWQEWADLRREFERLGRLLKMLRDDKGMNLGGIEIEADCHLGQDEEYNQGFSIPCDELADGDMSTVDVFLGEIWEYVENNVPNCLNEYDTYHIPNYVDTVSVEITCLVQPENGSRSLHDIIDVFKYEIPFAVDEETGECDIYEPLDDEGFTLRLKSTQDDLENMILLQQEKTERRVRRMFRHR